MAANKKPNAGKLCPFCIIALAITCIFNCAAAILCLTPKRYEVAVGSVAAASIVAPRVVENPTVTSAMRQSARDSVPAVYAIDTALAESQINGAEHFFSSVASFRDTAEQTRVETTPRATTVDGEEYTIVDTRTWQEVILNNELLAMTLALPMPITDASLGYALLDASNTELSDLETHVLSTLQEKLYAGVSEKERDSVLAAITKDLQVTTIPVKLKSIGAMLYEKYLQPTNVMDTVATTRDREKAAAAVEPTYISRGGVIVEKGQEVTSEQMQVLLSLDMVKGANVNSAFNIGVALYLVCLYAMLLLYLRYFERPVFDSNKYIVLLLIVLLVTIGLQWLSFLIDTRITTSLFAVVLIALLVSPSVAQAVNITLALSFALLSGGGGSTMFGSDSVIAMASMLAGGQIAILAAKKSEKRGSLIGAGTLGGAAGAIVILASGMILGRAWSAILIHAGISVAAALILSVFCVGTLSMWENVFDIVTTARLHELANTNHPLLKKLMTSAPGTYHHSMMTASLAEGAAEAVGANSLLARTGAMYHDVGKLRRPFYFKENQTDRNIHDTLPPEESAGYIIAHVKDADALLGKYHMPSAIRQIANEHHGTTLVAYFYYQALKQQKSMGGGEPVIERLFRYQGSLPSTKESAIVMLSDSCEAAVRSINDPTREDIAQMVHKVVQGKLDDNQLVACPLTLSEINRIEKSFCATFVGLLHERIRYPEDAE